MNVIGSRPDGWWKDRQRAMVALVERLDAWASHRRAERRPGDRGVRASAVGRIRSSVIEVAYAPKAAANSADDEIVRLVQADHPRRPKFAS